MTAGGVLLCQTETEGDAVAAPQMTAPAAGGTGSHWIPSPPAHHCRWLSPPYLMLRDFFVSAAGPAGSGPTAWACVSS